MTDPLIRIIDGDTVTDREMTDAEAATHKTILDDAKTQAAAQAAAQAAHTAAKASAYKKLAALGLTADEIAAL